MLWENMERLDSMEHFREYGDSFINYPFRYYCRKCVRNFNTKIRVGRCTKCLGEEIVELPSGTYNVSMERFKSGREPGFFKKLFTRKGAGKESKRNVRKELLQSQEKLIGFVNHHIGRINEILKNTLSSSESSSEESRPVKRKWFFILMPARKQKEEMLSYAVNS